ncbi:hypothetical protein F5887DRAFT_932289 [Amanita rubescens]|nr:hypothetical protein F5887DRAFT_927867 [Amanita rubescens]KAF8351760.1 hypothetical protein F5887DRAFT_932289 [Amanita rubescens]
MSSRRGGRPWTQTHDEVYNWFLSIFQPGVEKLPNFNQLKIRLVEEALQRGLNYSSLVRGRWQCVLYEGTIHMIQGDPTPSGGAPPSQLVWTPSRKHARSASSELYSLSDFSEAVPDPLTPAPVTPAPSAAHLVSALTDPLAEILNREDLSYPPGSLASQFNPTALARLLSLLGVSPPPTPSLPFAGPACPRCLPSGIFHAVDTLCPLAKSS